MFIQFVLLEICLIAPVLWLLEHYFSPPVKMYACPCYQSPGSECYISAISVLPGPVPAKVTWPELPDGSQSARPDGPLCTHYLLLIPLWRWGHHKWHPSAKYSEFYLSVVVGGTLKPLRPMPVSPSANGAALICFSIVSLIALSWAEPRRRWTCSRAGSSCGRPVRQAAVTSHNCSQRMTSILPLPKSMLNLCLSRKPERKST